MTTNHTPGPFDVYRDATPDYAPQFSIFAEGAPMRLATVTGDNAEADAYLFAAAPDLLKAAEDVLEALGSDGSYNDWGLAKDALRAAVAAARIGMETE